MEFLPAAKDIGIAGIAILAFVWYGWKVLEVIRAMASDAANASIAATTASREAVSSIREALEHNTTVLRELSGALGDLKATTSEMYGYLRKRNGDEAIKEIRDGKR